MDSIKKTSSVT